ncbi:methyl-accepting chemotaxis protein [Chitinimonas sp.]|uniref:methyl-accepting chemotaxis protein n=1 Tax=Chitinimonas sp. TaxID=1934313 RepID=UPI002F93CC09
MKWTVGRKIAMGYAVVLIAMTAIGITAYRSLNSLLDATNWRAHTVAVQAHLGNTVSLLKDAETGQRGYLLTGRDDYLQPYLAAIPQIENALTSLRTLTRDNPNQQRHLELMARSVQLKLDELKETIGLRRDKGLQAALDVVLTGHGKKEMDNIRFQINAMETAENALFKQREAQLQESAEAAIAVVLYGIPLVLLLVVVSGVLVARNIAAPARRLVQEAGFISAGDLSQPLEASSTRSDELGVLTDAFSHMRHSLQTKAEAARRISQGDLRVDLTLNSGKDELGLAFQTMVERLQEVVATLQQGTNVMTSVVGTVLTSATQVSAAADETATATNQLAVTVEELLQTTELTSQRMGEVSADAVSTANVAGHGRQAVSDTVEGMGQIQEKMQVVAERIAQLTEKSVAIGGIINVVSDLSEQSSILAVNASIEAAHASEQGKGFSVVAQEMKSLAEQSKQAVGQVRAILLDIQQLVSGLVSATEQGSRAVALGMHQSNLAGNAISQMAQAVASNAQAAQQIAVTATQQAVGVQQISAAMRHIRQGNMENLASMRAIEQAAKELRQTGLRLSSTLEGFTV